MLFFCIVAFRVVVREHSMKIRGVSAISLWFGAVLCVHMASAMNRDRFRYFRGNAHCSYVTIGDERPAHLWEAVEENDIEKVRVLLESGLQLDIRNIHGFTVLHHLILHASDLTCVRPVTCVMLNYLLQSGLHANVRSDYGVTPLHCAALVQRVDMVKLLLAAGAEVNAQTDDGHTSLHQAAYIRALTVVQELLAAGASPDICDNDGFTPQYYAVTAGADVDMVGQLRPRDDHCQLEGMSVRMEGLSI